MSHDREAAKRKELETRAALGPRLGQPKSGAAKDRYRRVAHERIPRATGAPGGAMVNGKDNNA